MDIEQLTNPVVYSAFTAWNTGDRDAFKALLTNDITFIHNGEYDDIMAFSDRFFFGESLGKFTGILKTENAGQIVYATLETEETGKVDVLMVFKIVDGKIIHLNAGRP